MLVLLSWSMVPPAKPPLLWNFFIWAKVPRHNTVVMCEPAAKCALLMWFLVPGTLDNVGLVEVGLRQWEKHVHQSKYRPYALRHQYLSSFFWHSWFIQRHSESQHSYSNDWLFFAKINAGTGLWLHAVHGGFIQRITWPSLTMLSSFAKPWLWKKEDLWRHLLHVCKPLEANGCSGGSSTH